MAEVIKMPKMSDTMTEGVIASWLKKVGDPIKSGDILAEVETDKATMELEAYDDGTLLHIGIKEGEAAPVDGIIAIIGKKGESFDDLLTASAGPEVKESADPVEDTATEDTPRVTEELSPAIDTSTINATVITMPKMSDTMEEGTIAQWLKKVGDSVKSGDILAEVETDKATMELESYDDGTLLYTGPKAGEAVAVDGVLAIIGEAGADYQALLQAQDTIASKPETVTVKPETPVVATESAPPNVSTAASPSIETAVSDNGRIKASPLAKKMAKDLGYNISEIKGSGDQGRIVKRDVESYKPGTSTATASTTQADESLPGLPVVAGEESFSEIPVSQMRKIIAKRLSESKFTSPHFYLTMEINMDNAIAARKSMNEVAPVKISFNDLVVKAVAAALRQHPKVNSSWLGDKIRYNNHIHIGVAVAVDEGLLVPVVKFADQKSLSDISNEIKTLAGMAVNKQLQPEQWEGNTFTISNLGMFGIEEFTAIINPPDACIMAVGGIKQTAVVKDGELVPGNVMKVTLSCDHRVVDGAIGSAFLKTFKALLEDPVRMLV
jgi:pyruvate dehydrogenase E2 component (dihydrolipoyllysine-residue acetyltransferase)